jgi:hypothetical protein
MATPLGVAILCSSVNGGLSGLPHSEGTHFVLVFCMSAFAAGKKDQHTKGSIC